MREKEKSNRLPKISIFWLLTLVYFLAVALICALSLKSFSGLKADGWGDFLSGVFSPLAFLWLLYAALAQKAELELQREEIRDGNETQKQQYSQLERQANALDAQVKKLEAQAVAALQPVLVLDTSAGVENGVQLYIKNLGAPVLDVYGLDGVRVQSVTRPDGGLLRNIPDGVCAYWQKDFSLVLFVPRFTLDGSSFQNEYLFKIHVTRLDLIKLVYSVKFLMIEQRIVLERMWVDESAP